MTTPAEVSLLAKSFLYESGLTLVRSCSAEAKPCLEAVTRVVRNAWAHHPGRFADGALENWVLRHGLQPLVPPRTEPAPLRPNGDRRPATVHVATEVYGVGGHTRLLAKWILRDSTSSHAVVLTEQKGPVPDAFLGAVAQAGAGIVSLPTGDSILERAAALRSLAGQFDRVVLHSHPHDTVPMVAFACAGGPPVAMFNHAHFGFCLGSTVSDVIVNTVPYTQGISKRCRFARQTALLPLIYGLQQLELRDIDKEAARIKLGFTAEAPIVLSIAHEHYYAPAPGYNFFQTASKLLAAHPEVHLLVVGVPPTSPLIPPLLREEKRFHCAGVVTDPLLYYQAADVFLESFPIPSLGALTEAVAHGEAYPVPIYGPGESIFRVEQPPVLTYSFRPKDETEYVSHVIGLLGKRSEIRERARKLRQIMIEFDAGWSQRLADLNGVIDGLKHEPSEIQHAPLVNSEDSRQLASLAPLDLAVELDSLLPRSKAIQAKIRASVRGYLPRTKLVTGFVRVLSNGIRS